MPSEFFVTGLADIQNGDIRLGTDTLKLMLVNSTYSHDPDTDVVDTGADDATDPSHCEIVATNYTGGFNGAGRKTVSITVAGDKGEDHATITLGDLTWASLGGDTNATIGGAILIQEGASDTDSRVIAYFAGAATYTTDGTSLKVTGGLITIPTA